MMKGVLSMSANRREFLTTASIVLAGSALGRVRLLAQQPAQTPPVPAFTDLRGNVGIFTARGGTIGWLVSPDGVIVIDSQFPDTAAVCLEGLEQRSSKHPVDVLFLTHHHGDHTAGNITFKPVTKKIVAHVKEVEAQKAATKPGSEATQVYADATFTETWTEKLGRETIEARHLGPAHTGGDAVVYFHRANVVHMGDLVFNRLHPYIDKAAGASIVGWITLLERVARSHSAETIFIFGHAKPGWKVTGGRPELLFMRDYLAALLDYARAEIKAGKSRDEIVKSTAELKGFPDHGPLIPRVLTAAFDELSAK
jgi:glyoxylase-like metal-dependent hydrolase (beta-lactamase superfamily II)